MHDFQDDFYKILGVEEASTPEEIRKAYLKLARKLHPDRFPNDPEKRVEAQAEFSKIARAHDTLSSVKQRKEYDALRALVKNKMAIDTGEPAIVGAAARTAIVGAAAITVEQKEESNEVAALKHFARATEMLNCKKFSNAESAIEEAIRLSPNNCSYHVMLAEIHLAQRRDMRALTAVQAALKLGPKNPDAKFVELKIKISMKQALRAKEEAKKAQLAANSGLKGFLNQLKKLLSRKR